MNVLDFGGGHGHVVAVQHDQVRLFADFERAERTLLKEQIRVRARVRNERFLARQSLVEHAVAAGVETADHPTERYERAVVRNDGGIRAQPEDDPAVSNLSQRHVSAGLHRRAVDAQPFFALCTSATSSGYSGMLASHSNNVETPPVSSCARRYKCHTGVGTGWSCVSSRYVSQSVGPATCICTTALCGILR